MSELRREQKALEQRRLQLEKELHRDMNDIKAMLVHGDNSFFGILKKQYAGKLLAQGLSFGAGILTKKVGGEIGSKIFSWLK
jgi:hypothetical protein